MDAHVEFIEGDWDKKYELSTLHLSYLLQTLFPLHVIKWDTTKKHYENIKSNFACFTNEIVQFIVTGSMSEGYSIPPYINRMESAGKTPDVEILSDVDTLFVSSQFKVSTEERLDDDTAGYKAHFEYVKDNPGYVRICLPSTKESDETFIYDETSGKYYMSGTKYTEKLFRVLSETEDVTQQGPAISMIDELRAGSKFNVKDGVSKDLVLALPCSPWPRVADAWRERVNKSRWIRPEVIESMITDGCHVVGVPSKQSEHPDLEWRLSFSASEGKLAREAVTDHQRQCFIYVKILHHQKIKPMGILSSYVFKSVFLHCCERLPVSHWKDYPGNCILYILDVVIDCLKRKHVPTYFLPEINLIRHLNDAEIGDVIATVEDVRKDPITPVLEFTDNRLFSHHCVYFTFREMVEPLLNDMKAFKDHRNKEMSILNGIVATGYRICHFLIAEKSSDAEAELFKHQEAIRCVIGVYTNWLQPMNINATLVKYVDEAGNAFIDPQLRLTYLATVVSLETEFPEFASLKLKLARMYHRSACSKDVTAMAKQDYITKAKLLYERMDEDDAERVIDYAVLLLTQKRFADAQKLLERFLREHTEEESIVEITFNSNDKDCLVGQLQAYIEVNDTISCDVVSFALYFMVYCLCSCDNANCSQDTLSAMKTFEGHYTKTQNPNTQLLLNFAKALTKERESVSYFNSLYRNCLIL